MSQRQAATGWFHKSPTSEDSAPLFKRIPWWKDHRKDFFFKPTYIPTDCKGVEHTEKCHKVKVRATFTWCASCPVTIVCSSLTCAKELGHHLEKQKVNQPSQDQLVPFKWNTPSPWLLQCLNNGFRKHVALFSRGFRLKRQKVPSRSCPEFGV